MADIHANGKMTAKITVGNVTTEGISEAKINKLLETKADINHTHDEYPTYSQFNRALTLKASKNHEHDEYLTEVPNNYAFTRLTHVIGYDEETGEIKYNNRDFTQDEFAEYLGTIDETLRNTADIAVYNREDIKKINKTLESKADNEHVHSYNDLTDKPNIPSIEGLASEEYVNNQIDAIPEVDLSNCATKEELNEVKQSVSNGKELLASAITDKGVNTSKDDTFQTMANNVSQITTGDGPVYENPDFYELRTKGGTEYRYLFYEVFYGSNVQLDLSGWDTSNVTNIFHMFDNCIVGGFNFTGWDTSKVTSMIGMFSYCTSLTSLDLSNFNTSKVTNMQGMFSNCTSLTSLDLSNFDTSNVTSMSSMFDDCTSLNSLDVSNFNTSNVTDMVSTFYNCNSLTTLDLSNWDTSKVTSMQEHSGGFIADCDNLEEVIGILDLSKVSGLSYSSNDKQAVFRACPKLKKLQLKNIYKDVSMTDNNKWTINLSGTIIEDQYLISIINELPDLINDKGLTAPSKIKLMLPPTNTLTQEQVKPAIDKGWNVANTTY